MRIKFYKIRALTLLYIAKFFAILLRVEFPPIFSVAAIIKKNNKYLFLNLEYFKGYCLPGGHVQTGENLDEALAREVYEETGLEVVSSKIFNSYPSVFKGFHQVAIAYFVETKGSLKNSEEGKLYWLEINDVIPHLVYKDNELILRDLLKDE